MKSLYDPELLAEIRQRMSPPNRESVAEIARSTGVNVQTLYSWRHRWKQEGQLMPATSKAPEQWSASDKLAAVIQAAGLSGPDLGAYCRERGLFPKQLARWRQVAEDANSHSAPSMSDQKELQRQNQQLIRQNRRLERELQKKEKALAEAATLLMLVKKRDLLWPQNEET
jgi:transposase-like protein